MTEEDATELVKIFALKEVNLCVTEEQLNAVHKKWKHYLIELNKFYAGKRDEIPYIENGNVI